MNFPRTPQGATRLGASVFALFKNLHAVNENVFHADGILMRLVERRVIGDRPWIEHDHIREHSFFNETAMIEAEVSSWQSAQPSHRLSHRGNFLIPDIFAEHAREIPVGARMRVRFQEHAFRGLRRFI